MKNLSCVCFSFRFIHITLLTKSLHSQQTFSRLYISNWSIQYAEIPLFVDAMNVKRDIFNGNLTTTKKYITKIFCLITPRDSAFPFFLKWFISHSFEMSVLPKSVE